jgi:hypothetical protein
VFGVVAKLIHQYYTGKAEAHGIKDATPGSVSFTQRWGSALNLTPHMHILCIDGVYTRSNGHVRFRNLSSITDDEVSELVQTIADQIKKLCIKEGYLSPDGDAVSQPNVDSLFSDHDLLAMAVEASIAGKIAFGPNQGNYVRKIGKGFGYEGEIPLAKGKRCYSVNGFSLHANTAINTHSRDKLYKLIEYMARGPISNDRLELLDNGEVKLALKTPWANGTTHLLFTRSEFIEKLVALIPPPKTHLVTWRGVFAPNSPYKNDIRLRPAAKKGFEFEGSDIPLPKSKNYTWSKMLAKTFKIDVTKCQSCQGDMRKLAAVIDALEVRRFLKHIGLDYTPPPRGPPQFTQLELSYDGWLESENYSY